MCACDIRTVPDAEDGSEGEEAQPIHSKKCGKLTGAKRMHFCTSRILERIELQT